jgi:sodium transport system permease protein
VTRAQGDEAQALSLRQALELCGLSLALFVSVGALLPPEGLLGIVAFQLLVLAGPTLLLARLRGDVRGLLGLAMPSVREILGALLVGAGTWYLLDAWVIPLQERLLPAPQALTEELERTLDPTAPLWLLLITFALAPAVCEELLFRGALLRALCTKVGVVPAVVVSALCFGVFHLSIHRAVPTFLLGLSFGTALVVTRSVVPPMVMHAVNNTAVLLLDPRRNLRDLSWLPAHPLGGAVIALTFFALGWMLLRTPDRPSP